MFSLFPEVSFVEIPWAVMHAFKVIVQTGQRKVLSSSWQTKRLDLERQEDPFTNQFRIGLFGI